MCGIAGISGSFDSTALRAALSALVHRGPDHSGTFEDHGRGIGLAHTRLSILDVSPLGHQPMASDDGEIVLVFNGEIYNFRELRADLEAKGFVFRSRSDTEVLLNLYLADDEAMLPRLNGIFAFAIWDAGREELLLARDGMGVKPLYYAQTPPGVSFRQRDQGAAAGANGFQTTRSPTRPKSGSFVAICLI